MNPAAYRQRLNRNKKIFERAKKLALAAKSRRQRKRKKKKAQRLATDIPDDIGIDNERSDSEDSNSSEDLKQATEATLVANQDEVTRAPITELSSYRPNIIEAASNKEISSKSIAGVFMPFEDPCRFQHHSIDLPGTRSDTNFFKLFPHHTKSTIETMSEKEIERVIAEINKRPSKKEQWGVHLKFKKDIHNENEGAWRSKFPPPLRVDDVHMLGSNTEKSLNNLFCLPEAPTIMLYEKNLAFHGGGVVYKTSTGTGIALSRAI